MGIQSNLLFSLEHIVHKSYGQVLKKKLECKGGFTQGVILDKTTAKFTCLPSFHVDLLCISPFANSVENRHPSYHQNLYVRHTNIAADLSVVANDATCKSTRRRNTHGGEVSMVRL